MARRHDETLRRALDALAADGLAVSIQAVARRAGVSRQWLYMQPELRARIEQLRDRQPSPTMATATALDDQRARERSLRQRNEALLVDNRRLRAENQTLRDELAVLYGQLRDRDETR
ncbi:MAG: DUF6262 family protein [Chloroflexota bacterium]